MNPPWQGTHCTLTPPNNHWSLLNLCQHIYIPEETSLQIYRILTTSGENKQAQQKKNFFAFFCRTLGGALKWLRLILALIQCPLAFQLYKVWHRSKCVQIGYLPRSSRVPLIWRSVIRKWFKTGKFYKVLFVLRLNFVQMNFCIAFTVLELIRLRFMETTCNRSIPV